MHAAVDRLRERGIRLPKLEHPVSGELQMHTHQVGTNDPHKLQAELGGMGGRIVLPPLHSATVRRGTTGGMVIRVRRSCQAAAPRVGWRRSG